MKLQASRWVLTLFVLGVSPAIAAGQDHEGRAKQEGKVVNAEGQGLESAIVTAVFLETGTGPDAEEANRNGDFEVEDLRPGMWRFTAAAGHLGYGAESVEVEVRERDQPDIELTLEPLQSLLEQANGMFQRQQFADARALFMKIFIALPDNVALNQPIAVSYQEEGLHEEALEHFDALLEGWAEQEAAGVPPDPRATTEVRLQAAASLASLRDYERMHAYIDEVAAASFDDAAVTALLAVCANTLMTEQENYEQAIAVLNTLVERTPTTPLPYYYRGMANVRLENDEAATTDLERFIELSPTESAQVQQAKDILTKLQGS